MVAWLVETSAHHALLPGDAAVDAAGVEAALLEVVVQQVQHLRHLAEDQHLQRDAARSAQRDCGPPLYVRSHSHELQSVCDVKTTYD